MILQINDVIRVVSEVTGISQSRICMHDRHDPVAAARFMVYYALHYACNMGYAPIGRAMSRNHASVINGITVAESWDKSNRLRDKKAKENGAMLEEVMSKLRQIEYAHKFRTTKQR